MLTPIQKSFDKFDLAKFFTENMASTEYRFLDIQKTLFQISKRKTELQVSLSHMDEAITAIGEALDESGLIFRHYYETSCENLRSTNFKFVALNQNKELQVYSLADPDITPWTDDVSLNKWIHLTKNQNWAFGESFEESRIAHAVSNFLVVLEAELDLRGFSSLTRFDLKLLEAISKDESIIIEPQMRWPMYVNEGPFQELDGRLDQESIEIICQKFGFVFKPQEIRSSYMGFTSRMFDPKDIFLSPYTENLGTDERPEWDFEEFPLKHENLHYLINPQIAQNFEPFQALFESEQIFINVQNARFLEVSPGSRLEQRAILQYEVQRLHKQNHDFALAFNKDLNQILASDNPFDRVQNLLDQTSNVLPENMFPNDYYVN